MIRRVQNIYYMLAYAFQVLHEKGYRDVASEEFENGLELLSAILCRGVSTQIKRGLLEIEGQFLEISASFVCVHFDSPSFNKNATFRIEKSRALFVFSRFQNRRWGMLRF